MAVKNKTQWTDASVAGFIEEYVENEQKKADSFELLRLMETWSGFKPEMWGPTIVGFGRYHYKYASGHEGDAPIIGFSPRKAEFSLYVYSSTDTSEKLLESLGKFKMGKACIYVKKLVDINIATLEALCKESIAYIAAHHECACHK
ncbi:DUF1801 domain-containing protein [Flavobacterium sp. Sd200]|uniref:DUF1801 domain-containing protein n=1 Tax=Flavobacterium sp. Sd200 TaxID=2692211 RepID=UPI00136C6687|nr:DUF1801 domain-containing protein [Flavobacterium sp. Sd200]MXN92060.1 DUF1801 domain-containing protein [Flavobacterium sp. Sd200]